MGDLCWPSLALTSAVSFYIRRIPLGGDLGGSERGNKKFALADPCDRYACLPYKEGPFFSIYVAPRGEIPVSSVVQIYDIVLRNIKVSTPR